MIYIHLLIAFDVIDFILFETYILQWIFIILFLQNRNIRF